MLKLTEYLKPHSTISNSNEGSTCQCLPPPQKDKQRLPQFINKAFSRRITVKADGARPTCSSLCTAELKCMETYMHASIRLRGAVDSTEISFTVKVQMIADVGITGILTLKKECGRF
jgi:hypothetical protein